MFNRSLIKFLLGFATVVGASSPAVADVTRIEFNEFYQGVPYYLFNPDGVGSADVIFSTTDPSGFNRQGPWALSKICKRARS